MLLNYGKFFSDIKRCSEELNLDIDIESSLVPMPMHVSLSHRERRSSDMIPTFERVYVGENLQTPGVIVRDGWDDINPSGSGFFRLLPRMFFGGLKEWVIAVERKIQKKIIYSGKFSNNMESLIDEAPRFFLLDIHSTNTCWYIEYSNRYEHIRIFRCLKDQEICVDQFSVGTIV